MKGLLMNQITAVRNGSVVSSCCGTEHGDTFSLPVSGIANENSVVFVNGIRAERDGMAFSVEVPLSQKINSITMTTNNEYGDFTQTLKILWDKHSFPRYNFFIDDNIFFLTDIAKERPRSLFDHFYLAFLKKLHHSYDAKFTLNLFYRNDHFPFELKDFPDCYKSEFQDNADWLRLSWHSYSEFPDRPYQNASHEKLMEDIDLLHSEIIRFAGEETFIPPVAVHWSMVQPDALKILRERGVKVLIGQFMNPKTALDEKSSSQYVCDIGYFRNLNDCLYLAKHQLLHDFTSSITFLHSLLICNYWSSAEIVKIIDRAASDPCYNNLLSFETHEQYSFPYYFNYLPDHLERIETAVRRATELGYKPVFFAEGFLGNHAWNYPLTMTGNGVSPKNRIS